MPPKPSTDDALFGGELQLVQPARGEGYRANVDALILAAFASEGRKGKVAYDLGAGTGVVGLSLCYFGRAASVVLVELDAEAARLAAKNVAANDLTDRVQVVHADVMEHAKHHRAAADLIVCNPPYVEAGSGRKPKTPARARARQGSLEHFVRASRQLAGMRARVCFVYRAVESTRLFETLRASGLEPKRVRYVHSTIASEARIVLVEAQSAKRGGLRVMPPLIERENGGYSQEMLALFSGELSALPGTRSRAAWAP